MAVTVKFLGASGTVTGSKYLVEGSKHKVLVDCGVFQGNREWRERNWNNFETYAEVKLKEIDAVLLTHAHIDHTAFLPRLITQGLRCPVYATKPTRELAALLLPDYGKIQEEDAAYRKRKKISRHSPPLPLYTEKDGISSLDYFKELNFGERKEVLMGVYATWNKMGHILGAGSITLEIDGKKIVFSGDIGRYNVPILVNPEPVEYGDLLLIESTYGNREHAEEDPRDKLSKVINETVDRAGVVVVPSFAVGRTQLLLFYIRELKEKGLIPDIPVIVDSPMAKDATSIYSKNPGCYDEESLKLLREGSKPFTPEKTYFIKDWKESKRLNSIDEPMVIISASGMVTGGRVQHHIYHRITSPLNTVLFVGYQAHGTTGAWIQSGADNVRLFKEEIPIRAKIEQVSGLSAHADRSELLRWCNESEEKFGKKPQQFAVVHGEPDCAKAFKDTLKDTMHWKDGFVAEYLQKVTV